MKVHRLKTDHEVFIMSLRGDKPLELRFNDRNFMPGDFLILEETRYSGEEMKNGKPLEYTGRALSRIVTCVIEGYGLMNGYVALGVQNV